MLCDKQGIPGSGPRNPSQTSNSNINLDAKRDTIAHLATSTYLGAVCKIVLLGLRGTCKIHFGIGLGLKSAHQGHRDLFASAND